MIRYQLVHYGEDAATSKATYRYVRGTESSVKARAGTLAKQIKGPVDIALSGSQPWSERYLTTAAPSEFHAKGFRFERLDS